jgi:hypothetical protein
VELAVGLAVAVVVLGLADVDAFEDADGLVVAVAVCAEGEGSVLAVGDFEAVGVAVAEVVAVGSLVDGCGLGEPLGVPVGVGVAVGEEVDSGSGWHCWTAPADTATAAVSSTGGSENPVAAAARTPPVTTPTTTGCTCAIRMKGPARAARGMPCSCCAPHWTPTAAPSASPLLPTVRERSRPNTDDLTTSAVLEGRLSRTFVTLSNVCRCLIMSVLGIEHGYTGLTRCQVAPR